MCSDVPLEPPYTPRVYSSIAYHDISNAESPIVVLCWRTALSANQMVTQLGMLFFFTTTAISGNQKV